MLCASCENAEAREVLWRKRIDVGPKWRLEQVTWCIDAANGNVEVCAKGDHGGNTPLTMVSLTAVGSINAPLTAQVYAPSRRYLTLSIKGVLCADAKVKDVELLMS